MHRRVQAVLSLLVMVVVMTSWPGRTAVGQDIAMADRGPRFLYRRSPATAPVEIDASRTAVLRRAVTLRVDRPTIGRLLTAIEAQTGLTFVYGTDLTIDRPVLLRADSISVAGALTVILLDSGLDVVLSPGKNIALVHRRGVMPSGPSGMIVGRVTDSKTSSAIRRAEVFLDGTHWRTTTDTGGQYRFGVVDAGRYTLTVRLLGYMKQSRPIVVHDGQTDTIDVALAPTATRLTDLVSTATGRRRRIDIANDITTINADSVMQAAPIRSVTDLLENRVPGMTIQRTSGAPGDPARIRLRGLANPLGSNDPIIVVDGIRINADASRTKNLATGGLANSSFNTPSPLDYIDPNSIETIEVLKDPSAATLYGPDAANGVIVITTKKGKAGPTRWSARAERGQTLMAGGFPDLMLRWGHRVQSGAIVACPVGNVTAPNNTSGAPLYLSCSADSVVRFQLLNDPTLSVLDRGHRTSVSLGADGGSQGLTYMVTGSYQNEVGLPTLPSYEADLYQARVGISPPDWMRRPQNFNRWNLTANFRARLSATADLNLSTSFFHGTQQRSNLEQQLGSLMSIYVDKASGTSYTGDEFGTLVPGGSLDHGFLQNYYTRGLEKPTQFVNRLGLNWRLRPWLTVAADAGLDVQHQADEVFLPRGAIDTVGYLNTGQKNSVEGTINAIGTAIVPLRHGFQFRFATGLNYISTSTDDQSLFTSHLPFGTSQQGTTIAGANHSDTSGATFGWFIDPSIGSNKLNFSVGLRLDGSSRYGGAVNGLSVPKLPRLGFSYLISDESWFPFKTLFSSLRLRTSYGKASQQPGITDRLRTYSTASNSLVNGQFVDEVELQSLGNTKLRPQRVTGLEGGFDADLLDSRVSLTLSGYRKTTDDAILPKPVAPSVYGGGTIATNIGRVRNTGFSLDVTGQLVRTGALTWSTNLLLNQNRNVVVSLGPDVQPFYTENSSANGATSGGIRVAQGYPLGGRWSRPILGYADVNHNGGLEASEILIGDTAVYVGQTEPNYTVGLSSTLLLFHGAVTVNAGFAYQNGLSQVNTVAQQLAAFSPLRNDSTSSLAAQLGVFTGNGIDGRTDYNWIQTVNTFRFHSLSLTYQVPSALARRVGAQTLNLSLQGGNLGLWTNYRGADPNVSATATGNNVVDTGILPLPRTWQLQINATY